MVSKNEKIFAYAKINSLVNKHEKIPKGFFVSQKCKTFLRVINFINNKKIIWIIAIILLISLSGCKSTSKEQAETIAKDFVDKRVKFYAKEEDSTLNLPEYEMDILDSYKEDNNWIVLIHVSSTLSNETKKNDLVVTINKNGNVINFKSSK